MIPTLFQTSKELLHSDVDITLLDILTIVEHSIAIGNDIDVLQANAVDGHFGQTIELHSATGTVADDVLDVNIAEDGGLLGDRLLGHVVGIVAIGQHLGHRLAAI